MLKFLSVDEGTGLDFPALKMLGNTQKKAAQKHLPS